MSNPYCKFFNVKSMEELEHHMSHYNAFVAQLDTDESHLYHDQLAS